MLVAGLNLSESEHEVLSFAADDKLAVTARFHVTQMRLDGGGYQIVCGRVRRFLQRHPAMIGRHCFGKIRTSDLERHQGIAFLRQAQWMSRPTLRQS